MTGKADKDMVIYLPAGPATPGETPPAPQPSFDELTPREIVAELDKYIVGQNPAKRAVAIALRNRVRPGRSCSPKWPRRSCPRTF